MIDFSPEACVDRGIDFLDGLDEDWDLRMYLIDFDMELGCHCVCGLYWANKAAETGHGSGYDWAIGHFGRKFKIDWDQVPPDLRFMRVSQNRYRVWGVYLGFDVPNNRQEYGPLQELWVREIARRQVQRATRQEAELLEQERELVEV